MFHVLVDRSAILRAGLTLGYGSVVGSNPDASLATRVVAGPSATCVAKRVWSCSPEGLPWCGSSDLLVSWGPVPHTLRRGRPPGRVHGDKGHAAWCGLRPWCCTCCAVSLIAEGVYTRVHCGQGPGVLLHLGVALVRSSSVTLSYLTSMDGEM